ncbi:DUF2313 domain-containing protein [Kaustia mangrovi]|uniref:DUF2313 domain-containing protein n=1 Tax=Kaustia mangrovi TaxID=2593653 RepID=A0A7S8C6C6_9HYPH|nr:putative phage tail protein [Kaustia mangrovi]QPC44014.1 DUF2313 domain-containing protein [Kaustia mangrovi]
MAQPSEAYARQLRRLLPQGAAWTSEPEGPLHRVIRAIADAFARIDLRAEDLVQELDPRTTLELLPDWERVLGLPDECITAPQTVSERRDAVVAKYTSLGGQSIAFYVGLAAKLGYDIEIREFVPFRAGLSRAGDPLTNPPAWPHTWTIVAPETSITWFRAGTGSAGDPLRQWGNEELECVFEQRKPAQTVLLFAYQPSEFLDWGQVAEAYGDTLDFGSVVGGDDEQMDFGGLIV